MLQKFKVSALCFVAEEIETPDNQPHMGTYPEKLSVIVTAPSCDIATAIVLGHSQKHTQNVVNTYSLRTPTFNQ